MIINLTGGDNTQYGKSIQKMDHNIADTGLFSDGNLIRALDMHPPENLDICLKGSFESCERSGASSFELLEAVKRGQLWLNLRNIHDQPTPHGRLVMHMHKAFERHMGISARSRIGGLLISSPRASVGYHIDLTDVTLWHLRGRKRLFVYPNHAPYIHSLDIQKTALQAGIEKIPYRQNFEDQVIKIDLEPGELICWPHLSPHRVDNLEGLNVSLSLESLTLASRLRVGAHYFDGMINHTFGTKIENGAPHPALGFSKAAIAAVAKKAGFTRRHSQPLKPAFKINLRKPGCVEAL